jgi:hypothetical protein
MTPSEVGSVLNPRGWKCELPDSNVKLRTKDFLIRYYVCHILMKRYGLHIWRSSCFFFFFFFFTFKRHLMCVINMGRFSVKRKPSENFFLTNRAMVRISCQWKCSNNSSWNAEFCLFCLGISNFYQSELVVKYFVSFFFGNVHSVYSLVLFSCNCCCDSLEKGVEGMTSGLSGGN